MNAEIRHKYVLELTEKEAANVYEALIQFRDNCMESTDLWLDVSNMVEEMPMDWPNF